MNYEIENLIYQIGLPSLKKIGAKFHFRCIVCGDSQKNERKRRGWIIERASSIKYQCYNCGYVKPFHIFLKEHCHHLYLEYLKIFFADSGKVFHQEKHELPKIEFDKIDDLPSILDLDPEHFARKYLISREIPLKFFDQIYFSYNYSSWINTKVEGKFDQEPLSDPRIVLPIYNIRKHIVGAQGRALDKGAIRYLTILFNEDELNVSGLNKVDRSKEIIVSEGFIDSLFLPNAISMNSSGVDTSRLIEIAPKDKFIFLYDNERRNKEIKKRMVRTAKAGFKIVIWPEETREWGKDINEMVLKKIPLDDIMNTIKSNTFSGILAETKIKLMR
jgi:hypothetical protein